MVFFLLLGYKAGRLFSMVFRFLNCFFFKLSFQHAAIYFEIYQTTVTFSPRFYCFYVSEFKMFDDFNFHLYIDDNIRSGTVYELGFD